MLHGDTPSPAAANREPAARRRSNMRWTIVGFSALGLTIAYLDRSALSVALPFISREFEISPAIQGVLLSSFFWTYALFQIPSGWLLDRLGPRLVYPIAVGWWSIWTALTAVAQGAASIIVFRLGLGIGEAPVQPANVTVVSKWFPRRERAFASSIFDMGQQIGVALSVPVVTGLAVVAGWRAVFVVIGGVGALWILGWLKVYRSPEDHPRVNAAELAHIRSDQAEMVPDHAERAAAPWTDLLRDGQVWALTFGYVFRSLAGAFFLTWYPSYLLQDRGLSEAEFGLVGAIPPLVAVGATVLGGVVSDRMLASGMSTNLARKLPIITGLALSACIAFTPFVESTAAVMALLTLSNAAHSFAGAAILSLPSEVAPSPDVVGSIAGFQNFGSQLGNIISPIAIGFFLAVSNNSYLGPMIFAGVSSLVSALIYGLCVRIKPVMTFDQGDSRPAAPEATP
ncbi:MFS transporter [Actinoalloteichus sp. AHMU CJ021]|uniref:MFS transporter, ACS family, glucarate transporter n=1 Tax=Actinoalloteichus caeruleus DSM 43889 TaxID=1120930 RepID=A0ABT1JDH8_ACTCY|nr:MFS transporter [Actinoalloteichus caeruleus]AUS80790.1 MFS transporter [Actinoalloteichus sp. AHMU CJ021]MCP2330196.1 MFS transporter, ACS family, glucarate transporter [Actinoalloteichus caeruleus DSM 43889]